MQMMVYVQILYTIAALGVADILGRDGPQTSHQLADTLGVLPKSCCNACSQKLP